MTTRYCSAFPEAASKCCGSCHQEEWDGYSMLDGPLKDGDWYYVCCSVAGWLEDQRLV